MGRARGWEIVLRLLTLVALVAAGWWLWQQRDSLQVATAPDRPLHLEKGTYLGPADTPPPAEALTAWNERAQKLQF